MSLRCGITTGTCAAAAAKAATIVLAGGDAVSQVDVRLPSGQPVRVPILHVQSSAAPAAVTASVRKDAGDDPDVTHGLEVRATVAWDALGDVSLVAGEGVGTVTRPGLQVPPGQPAINPVPRRMIIAAVREVTARGVRVEIAIPGGRDVAARTFNPRLGIEGGLSILGTTGVVRPYCVSALRDALKCGLDVADACGVSAPVLVPGNIGARAARRHFSLREEQLIETGNEWGFMLQSMTSYAFQALMVLGHPGKLAKLCVGQWDTHSARSRPALEIVRQTCLEVLGYSGPDSSTVEGLLAGLPGEQRSRLGDALAQRTRAAVGQRIGGLSQFSRSENATVPFAVAVFLVNMAGDCLGTDGDFSPWR